MFDEILGKPVTFLELMDALRDIVTSINVWIENAPGNQLQGINRAGAMSKENTKRDRHKSSAESSYSSAFHSLERKLHIVVQYLLYFRNTDGSFGEPMVEQSTR